MIYDYPRFLNSGDQYITIEIGDEMSLKANFKVIAIDRAIKEACIKGVVESLPGWRSLMLHYDSLTIRNSDLISEIKKILNQLSEINKILSRFIELPVKYGGQWGRDLDFVAKENGISADEVVMIHSETIHWIGMVGFTPGSPQLMQINPSLLLSVPKYTSPRLYTPLGTIGLGGSITAIYPVVSPGGYQMIGLTPVPIFDRFQSSDIFEKSPVLLKIGDRIKFNRIKDDNELDFIRQQVIECSYKYTIKEEEFAL
jgi:KipI family sensor histidine kinase inhibitor